MWKFPLVLLFPFIFTGALSQNIQITELKRVNGSVYVTFDVLDEKIDNRYSIYLYSSSDNYIQPLEQVSGDIGIDISVGGNKRIIWDAEKELGQEFKGNVALEIQARRYTPFIDVSDFSNYEVFKKGKEYNLSWTS